MHKKLIQILIDNNDYFKKQYNKEINSNKIHNIDSLFCYFEKFGLNENNGDKQPFVSFFKQGIQYIEPNYMAIKIAQCLKETNEKEFRNISIVIGKNYFLHSYREIYDCIYTWIETDNYIIDPLMGIIIKKSLKKSFLYKDIVRNENVSFNILEKCLPVNYSMNGVKDYYKGWSAIPSLSEFEQDMKTTKNNCLMFYKGIIDNSKQGLQFLFNKDEFLGAHIKKNLKTGKYKDLMDYLKLMPESYISDFNPDLTANLLFKLGDNYGHCGLFARLFARANLKEENYEIHSGICPSIKGSKNSSDGNHCWIETDHLIIDTSLMLMIPKEDKQIFGYITEEVETKNETENLLDIEHIAYSNNNRENKNHSLKFVEVIKLLNINSFESTVSFPEYQKAWIIKR